MGEMIAQHGNTLGIQFIDVTGAHASITHQAGLFEDPQVLRDGRARYRQAGGQLVNSVRVVTQHFEDGEPGGIAESGQSVLYVSAHLR